MTFIPDVRFNPERIPCRGKLQDDLWSKRNYKLCTAIDITNLSIVVQSMVDSGDLDIHLAEIYMMQARSLLALLRTENNRGMGF